jgi:hypothetical protein
VALWSTDLLYTLASTATEHHQGSIVYTCVLLSAVFHSSQLLLLNTLGQHYGFIIALAHTSAERAL